MRKPGPGGPRHRACGLVPAGRRRGRRLAELARAPPHRRERRDGPRQPLVAGGREPALEGRPHRPRHAGRVRRPRLRQRPRRRRADAPRAGGLLRRRHGQEALGAPLPGLQHDGALHAAWAGPRWPAIPRRATSTRRTWTASSSPSTATGKTVWEHRLGEEYGRGSGYGGRTLIPLVDEDRVVVGVVGAGWGDIGPPRQRYMAFDKRTGAVRWISTPGAGPVRRRQQPGQPDGGRDRRPAPGHRRRRGRLDLRGRGADRRAGVAVPAQRARAQQPARWSTATWSTPRTARRTRTAAPMGRVVAIDGKGTGDVTEDGDALARRRPHRRLRGAHRRPTGASTSWTTPPTSTPSTRRRASSLWTHNLGTIGRAAPLARRRQALPDRAEREGPDRRARADRREDARTRSTITMPEGRHAEVWGSVAVAYGRLYFTTEEGLYCRRARRARRSRPRPRAPRPPPKPPPAADAQGGAAARSCPARSSARPGEPVAFEAWSFDDKGRFLRKETATWSARRARRRRSRADGRLTDAGRGHHRRAR